MNRLISIGIVAIAVTSTVMGSATPIVRFKTDVSFIDAALDLFKQDVGRYPTSAEGLKALVAPSEIENTAPSGYIRSVSKDPWGNDYQYLNPGKRNSSGYDLWSFGADGLPGGSGFNSDLGNWPSGLEEYGKALAERHSQQVREALPRVFLGGLLFGGVIYLGISFLRLSNGLSRRRCFRGKSIWIGLTFFALYVFLVLPFSV